MDITRLLGNPALTAKHTPSANTDAVVTITGVAGYCIYLLGVTLSASAAPAATVEATIKDGSTILIPLEIPAAAFAPIVLGFGQHPIKITSGANAVVTLPALGGTTVGSVSVRYLLGPA